MSDFDRGGLVYFCAACGFRPKRKPEAKAIQTEAQPQARVMAIPAGNVVDQVRARLAALEVDIERLESLKRERMQLRRMLRAAESKR